MDYHGKRKTSSKTFPSSFPLMILHTPNKGQGHLYQFLFILILPIQESQLYKKEKKDKTKGMLYRTVAPPPSNCRIISANRCISETANEL